MNQSTELAPCRILFVAAEMAPLVKVGGLGEVVGALPRYLVERGHDVRVLLPAYQPDALRGARVRATLADGSGRLRELASEALPCTVLLLETSGFLRRRGRPYGPEEGGEWPDSAEEFGRLCSAAAEIAAGRLLPEWRPDIVHCHDWHTGIAPLRLWLDGSPAASVFTIHNLGFAGLFSPRILSDLGLPAFLHQPSQLEFHGDIAFIKGGLCFADQLTTVSPQYAREIQTPEFGAGLDGVMRERRRDLIGILNGIDTIVWDPARDPALEQPFDADHPGGKSVERSRLLTEFGLGGPGGPARSAIPDGRNAFPLLASIGRLTHQKGIDLLVEALPELIERGVFLLVLGSGEPELERALEAAARRWPAQVAVHVGFDEALAHRIYAGADMVLMPSRFEPCGLVQMVAMRYGTVPVVAPVGGLKDTVTDAGEARLDDGSATGFLMTRSDVAAMLAAVDRAITLFRDPLRWRVLVRNCMGQRCDWRRSVAMYEEVYARALARERSSSAEAGERTADASPGG